MYSLLHKQILTKLSMNISFQASSPSFIPYSPFSSLYLHSFLHPSLPPIYPLFSLPSFLTTLLPSSAPSFHCLSPPSYPLFPSLPPISFRKPRACHTPIQDPRCGGNLSSPTTGLVLSPTAPCPSGLLQTLQHSPRAVGRRGEEDGLTGPRPPSESPGHTTPHPNTE